MNRREFHKLISMDEARRVLNGLKISPRTVYVPIHEVHGSILAEDICSEIDVPAFNRASMDGYAVKSEDTSSSREDIPVELRLIGSIPAGEQSSLVVDSGTAVEIATGAVLPAGADAVVMVEYTGTDEENRKVLIKRPVGRNENVMSAGADIGAGEMVMGAGTVLTPSRIGVLAATGRDAVPIRSICVGIVSTGDELIAPGTGQKPGKIYDTNSYSLKAAVEEYGCTAILFGIVRDDFDEMRKTLFDAMEKSDIVLVSGSTSAGAGDMVYTVIEGYGEILFHGVNIKPGKPVIAGVMNGKPIIGLPGYPTSALTVFTELVAPLLAGAIGIDTEKMTRKARLVGTIRSEGRRQLLPVALVADRTFSVDKGSGAITSLADSDGFIEIPDTVEIIENGEVLQVRTYSHAVVPDALAVGDCPALGKLVEILREKSGTSIRLMRGNSTRGIVAVQRGAADIAGVHMIGDDGTFNLISVKSAGTSGAALVKGYRRSMGVLMGEDINIEILDDIVGSGITIANREQGSGERALLNHLLRDIADKRGMTLAEIQTKINGYRNTVNSPRSAAHRVKSGKADICIGTEGAADEMRLKFKPLIEEEYDLLVGNSALLEHLISALKSDRFNEGLPAGMNTYERTGEVVRL